MKDVNEEKLPLEEGETKAGLIALLDSVLFNPDVDNKRVNQADGQDLILTSANNYYAGGITQKEVEDFYAAKKIPGDSQPVSYGLNSTLVKKDGKIYEDVWKVGGKYSAAIEKIVYG
jgi:dipeptidyl-peptidase-3